MIKTQVPFKAENLFEYMPVGDWTFSVAIRIGHSAEAEGAESKTGLTEFDYNSPVAHSVADILRQFGGHVDIYKRDKWGEYDDMIKVLNERHRFIKYDADLSLHLNCYNGSAHGTEMLYHHKSRKGKILATHLLGPIVGLFNSTKHRGGLVGLKPGDNAYKLTAGPNPPTCVIEAEYIDNPKSEKMLRKYWQSYDEAIVDGLLNYIQSTCFIRAEDKRIDKWKWDGKEDLSLSMKELINGNIERCCPVCSRVDCPDFKYYKENSSCKNRA